MPFRRGAALGRPCARTRLEVDDDNTYVFLTRNSTATARMGDAIRAQLQTLVRTWCDLWRRLFGAWADGVCVPCAGLPRTIRTRGHRT